MLFAFNNIVYCFILNDLYHNVVRCKDQSCLQKFMSTPHYNTRKNGRFKKKRRSNQNSQQDCYGLSMTYHNETIKRIIEYIDIIHFQNARDYKHLVQQLRKKKNSYNVCDSKTLNGIQCDKCKAYSNNNGFIELYKIFNSFAC
eukprot:394048_1